MDTTTNTIPRDDRSLAGLIRDLREDTTNLFKQEVELAKTEMSEKMSKLGRNLAYLAVGGLVAYAGLIFILLAVAVLVSWGLASAGLSNETARWLGPLLVGVLVAVVGFALVMKARRTLSAEALKPEKTIQSLKEDKEWTQQKLQT